MSKRILSLMLCFVMVMSTLVVVPATVSAVEAGKIVITADKTSAVPGDTITYTVTAGAMDVTAIMVEMAVPAGLTYVSGSAIDKATLGWDDLSWTDQNAPSLMVSGYGESYTIADSLVLATFTCTVDSVGKNGDKAIEVTSYDVFDGNEDPVNDCVVSDATVAVSGVAELPEAGKIEIKADKEVAEPGDTITYTITSGAMGLTAIMVEVEVPEGLTYVSGSAIDKTELGWDDLSWTDENKPSLILSGYGDPYTVDASKTFATFTCTVNSDTQSGDYAIAVTAYDVFDANEEPVNDCVVNYATVEVDGVDFYTLTFNTGSGSAIAPVTEVENTVIDLNTKTPTLDGFVFKGWYDNAECTGEAITSVTLDANKTVYAKFVQGFTLTYYKDNEVYTTKGGEAGDTITLVAVPDKENYRALGWFDNEEGTGEAITSVTLTENKTVYAVYEYLPELKFLNVDGSEALTAIRATYKGEEIDLSAYDLTTAEYDHNGWYTEAELTNATTSVTLDADKEVYAKLETTLTLNGNGGTDSTATYAKGATVTVADLAIPTNGAFEFTGWYTDSLALNAAAATIVMDKHTTLYAGWTIDAAGAQASVPYTITAVARTNPDSNEKVFNAGDTIHVDYTVATTDPIQSLGSFQFDITYDKDMLILESLDGLLSTADGVLHANETTLRVNFDVDGNKPALDITGGKMFMTAVFTAKADVDGDTIVGFDTTAPYEVTPQGYDINLLPVGLAEETVTIENLYLTFVPGDYATFESGEVEIKTGIRYNVASSFLTPNFDVTADGIGLVANDSYRLAKDIEEDGERLWLGSDGEYYTSAKIKETKFKTSMTFTAQVVDIHDVTIVAGANGSVEGTTKVVKDTNYTFTKEELLTYVTPVGNPGYVFDAFDTLGPITADGTVIKALFVDGQYTVTNTADEELATVAITGGVEDGKATHGDPVTFTVTPEAGKKIEEVGYIVDGVKYPLTEANGEYTIPGAAITGNVDIYVVEKGQFTVTFVAGDNGDIAGATYYVEEAGKLADTDLEDAKTKATPDAGYKFVGFAIAGSMVTDADILEKPIYGELTITVIFDHNSYTLTQVDGVTTETVTHGTDYVFTPELEGKIITNVTATVGGNPLDPAYLTKDIATGKYTLNGDAITGDVVLTAETIDGTIRFILNRDYRALKGYVSVNDEGEPVEDPDRKIAVITLDNNAKLTGQKFKTAYEGDFYWSDRYGAYVCVVAGLTEVDEITAAMIAAQLTVVNEEATSVNYSGDMNGDGNVTVVDAMIITDMLYQKRAFYTTEEQVLQADVVVVNAEDAEELVEEGKEYVTTADVDAVREAAEKSLTVPELF